MKRPIHIRLDQEVVVGNQVEFVAYILYNVQKLEI